MARALAAAALFASTMEGVCARPDVNLSALHSRHGIPMDQFNLTDKLMEHVPPEWGDKPLEASTPHSRQLFHADGTYELVFACGVDVPGNDLFSTTFGYKLDCFLYCDFFVANCEGAVWTSYQGGTCWWKKKKSVDSARPNSDAASAVFMPVGTASSFGGGRWVGYDMPGFDVGHQAAATYAVCFALCAANTACWAITWTDYNGGTCWFKSQATEMVKKDGAISTYMWKDWKRGGSCMRGVLHS